MGKEKYWDLKILRQNREILRTATNQSNDWLLKEQEYFMQIFKLNSL